MSDLQSYLGSIEKTSNSIKTLYFTPPGIFTNSLVTKPNILSLLRDADPYENSLYQVDPQGKPERLDGTLGAVDNLNDDFDQLELQQQLNSDANDQDPKSSQSFFEKRRQAVIIPKKAKISKEKNDEDKGVKNLLKKFNETNQADYDVDVLCETIRQLLEKYPNENMSREIESFINQWEHLNTEIMKHEDTLEKQRRHLSMLNVSVNDREVGSNQPKTSRKRSAADIIAEEEETIRKLEEELSASAS